MSDAWSPAEIALRIEDVGVKKANLPAETLWALAALAGAFIGLGAQFFLVAMTGTADLGGLQRVIGGGVFSLGLILVVVAGAELFTGNNLMVMAWAEGRLSLRALLRAWGIVLVGNALGAVGLAVLVGLARPSAEVLATAVAVATAKAALPIHVAFLRGVLCNVLVCLAVWCVASCRSTGDKILAVLWPISGFVAMGFEHSVANFYLFPLAAFGGPLDPVGVTRNLLAVIAGNVVGGGGLVAATYAWIYLRRRPAA